MKRQTLVTDIPSKKLTNAALKRQADRLKDHIKSLALQQVKVLKKQTPEQNQTSEEIQQIDELSDAEKVALDYQQIINQFMEKGFDPESQMYYEEQELAADVSALEILSQDEKQQELLEQVQDSQKINQKLTVCRIKNKFTVLNQKSNLPQKMPETLVYWNRCLTQVDLSVQRFLKQWQLEKFYNLKGVKLHDYPEERKQVAPDFPLISGLDIMADPRKERFQNAMEKLIYNSPVVQDGIKMLHSGRPIEGIITIQNVRCSDVFFNSRFESGNLKQAFIIPQQTDFEEIQEEDMVIPPEIELSKPTTSSSSQVPNSTDKSINKLQKNQIYGNEGAPQQPKKKTPISEYNLYLQDDTHSDGSRAQWFYFSVMNIKAGTKIKLNILNLTKAETSFKKGMLPFVYSKKLFLERGIKWHRGGKKVTYQPSRRTNLAQIKVMDIKFVDGPTKLELQGDSIQELHTLSFQYKFQFDYDVVYFAHHQPYTYTDLQNYLCSLQANEYIKDRLHIDHLCNSLGKNPVYCVTITDKILTNYVEKGKEIYKWQKFEYDSNQNTDSVKIKKKKQKQTNENLMELNSFGLEFISLNGIKVQNKQGGNSFQIDDEITLKRRISRGLASEGEMPFRVGRLSQIEEQEHEEVESIQNENQSVDQINNNLENLQMSNEQENIIRRQPEQKKEQKFYKKCLFITSRVHPGDPQSSFLAQDIIDFLISDDEEAKEMRLKFVIKIIPMLNPDGVLLGNTRASLLGCDLNRRWQKPSKFLHPTIYYTKSLLKYLNRKIQEPEVKSGGVVSFIDIHGHARHQDMFMYSCQIERDYPTYEGNNIIKAIPDGVDRFLPVFNTKRCRFYNEPEKAETARLVVFRELKIFCSYTFQCSFFGSEFLKKGKQIYQTIYNKEFLETMNDKYLITPQRQDVFFDREILQNSAEDFIKGINYASKKKPLLQFWFRLEPKVLVDINIHSKLDANGQIDEEAQLKELEARWKPTAAVLDSRKDGMTDKFGGQQLEYIFDGPVEDENATLEKVAQRKREKAEKRLKKKQMEEAIKARKNRSPQKDINIDIANVSGKNFNQNKLQGFPNELNSSKSENKNSFKQIIRNKKKTNIPSSKNFQQGLNSGQQTSEASYSETDSETEGVPILQKQDQQQKQEILQAYQTGQTQNLSSRESILREPKFINQQSQQPARQQQEFYSIQISTIGEQSIAPSNVQKQEQTKEQIENQNIKQNLTSENMKKLFQDFPHKQLINAIQERGDLLEVLECNDSKTMNRARASLYSYRGSPENFDVKGEQLEPKKKPTKQELDKIRVKSTIIKEIHKKQNSVLLQNSPSIANYSQNYESETSEKPDQKFLKSLSPNKNDDQYPQVNRSQYIESEVSEGGGPRQASQLMKPQYFSLKSKQSQNKLATDPVTFSSTNFQNLSRINLKTIKNHVEKLQSPSISPKSKKQLFLPQNGVYSQEALLLFDGLAEQKGIHFTLDSESVFGKRKMTQIVDEASQNLLPEINSIQKPLQGQRNSQSFLTPHNKRVISIRNGFEMSENKSVIQEFMKQSQTSLTQRERLQSIHRPHIILKPLSDADWRAISDRRNSLGQTRSFGEMAEQEQRHTLKKLQQVIGTLEISKNKLKIGRSEFGKLNSLTESDVKRKGSIQFNGIHDERPQQYAWPPKL